MKKCWKKRTSERIFVILINLFNGFFSFCYLMFVIDCLLSYEMDFWFYVCLISPIIIISMWILIAIFDMVQKKQKYEVDKDGIYIEFLFNKRRIYSWDEVSEISVCDVDHGKDNRIYYFVIRVVIGNEPDGPGNPNCKRNLFGYEKWRTAEYGMRRMNKIILIEYDEERYIEIAQMSNMEIKDYRMKYSDANKIELPKVRN